MNRSSRGFGLAGVVFVVIIMVITAFFGARADAAAMTQQEFSVSGDVHD
ncbi:hypothetical protein KJY73_04540 [Bowmanella sp. Y26]|uniref:Uncharacterized protein n=1 Tax=Bowmanella yangjiangensis TaxID=2811230 RepID=A0ABS3CNY2_9ALTE|nr:hypothetical protein [Bowmanella yangjiangensis]MBN7818811.1 hypothetical protein [Bowmanella yangjiangensis]MBT1062829.1 hypothetical protein [Bowmanella yangjiangensis]